MTEQHPITPPPDKIHNWLQLEKIDYNLGQIITLAAQWGADQELDACCRVLHQHDRAYLLPSQLRDARRPKPPSLKERALAHLEKVEQLIADLERNGIVPLHEKDDTIRRALEALPDA